MTDPQAEAEVPQSAPRGPGWLPPPDPIPPTPNWLNGRSFPAVWRDTLPLTMGGLIAAKDHPHMRVGAGWNPEPDPGSDQDVDQAVVAKIHLGLRTLSVLAEAQLVVVEPAEVAFIPEWGSSEETAEYGARAQLPFSPLYLDLESLTGGPSAWQGDDSWPLPFHLRGAVCWETDRMLSIVPFGSVGGVHPWGGTDYQPWGRWIFLQDDRPTWPPPGPGDSITRADTHVASWVDMEGESVCAQQAAVAFNLAQRALRVLWAFEVAEVTFEPPKLSRPDRRRAKRAGQEIGLIPVGLPKFPMPSGDDTDEPADESQMNESCPVPSAHARLNQGHVLWHEALDAYNDPAAFVTKLNALIQTVRNVTWALQNNLGKEAGHREWYTGWQERMKADPRMHWAKEARNHIVKQGDLATHSTVRVCVVGDRFLSTPIDMDVEPGAPVDEIARRITLPALGDRVLREGTLVVERRWTVDALPDDELLDVMAHCLGMLSTLLVDAHTQFGGSMSTCEETVDDPCGWNGTMHPTGRLGCMWASREARTSRRNLSSGAPMRATLGSISGPSVDIETIRERYGLPSPEPIAADVGPIEKARILHEEGRRFLRVDKVHITIAWLLRSGEIICQRMMQPEDHREQYLAMEFLASEATKLGADAVILSAEAWEADVVPTDDPRARLRATERDDRREAFLTHVVHRDGSAQTWRSKIGRSSDGAVQLGDVETLDGAIPPIVRPVLEAWAEWSPRADGLVGRDD